MTSNGPVHNDAIVFGGGNRIVFDNESINGGTAPSAPIWSRLAADQSESNGAWSAVHYRRKEKSKPLWKSAAAWSSQSRL